MGAIHIVQCMKDGGGGRRAPGKLTFIELIQHLNRMQGRGGPIICRCIICEWLHSDKFCSMVWQSMSYHK